MTVQFHRNTQLIRIPRHLSAPCASRLVLGCAENSAIYSDAGGESAASSATDSAALKTHGLNCHTDNAFPCICHLLLRHPEDPAAALIENATAGGDSAARGMILGLVYGTKFPATALPKEWLSGLRAHEEIARLIHQLP